MPMQRYSKLYVLPESHLEIAKRARTLLVYGECIGVLPTPVQRLYAVGNVEEVEIRRSDMVAMFEKFNDVAKSMVSDMLSKVRGAADLRKRVIFMPQEDKKPRILFARAHELGHQTLPWHHLREEYLDDDRTLNTRASDLFEAEANLFAAELIYQGESFTRLARDYRPEFASLFELARMHGASKHATFWRFVQVHEDSVAGLVYYRFDRREGLEGSNPEFVVQNEVRSSTFARRYDGMTFDGRLDATHPWTLARLQQEPLTGEMPLLVDGRPEEFLWEAFWNGYCLMVLVRRRPGLRLLGSVVRRARTPIAA